MATNIDVKALLQTLSARLPRIEGLTRASVPSVGVEISSRRVTVVRARKERRGIRCLGHGSVELSEGAVQSSLLKCVVIQRAEVLTALKRAVAEAGVKGGRAALTLPDIAGRVTLLSVAGLPRSHAQAEELIRFRLKRTLPFKPEDVAVSFQRLTPTAEGDQVITVMAMRSVIEQHEGLLAEAGLRPGLVSFSTLELANLLRAELTALGAADTSGPGDSALLNCEPEYSTLALFRRGEIMFFRCKIHMVGEEADVAGRLRSLRRELTTSLSYYAEKLGGRLPVPALVRNLDPLAESLPDLAGDVGLAPFHAVELSDRVALPGGPAPFHLARLAPALGITGGRMR